MSDRPPPEPADPLKHTPLHALNVAKGARMVPFAGYAMPVNYAAGVLKEHLATRAAAGLFDASHMGQIAVRPRSAQPADAALALERLIPADLLALEPGRQRYALMTNDRGGIRDDLMIAHRGDHFLLVVNAACKDADEAHLQEHLAAACHVERLDRALIALQGPKAEAVLARHQPAVAGMVFMDVRTLEILGAACVVARSGYTGEDGFEISVPAHRAAAIAEALLDDAAVVPAGLGARDSLRLEAGLPLYGADLDTTTTPAEAGLAWSVPRARRKDGDRAGGFPGAPAILGEIARGTARRRVGLRTEGRAPVRAGAALFASEEAATPVGTVTSGGFGPTVDRPIAMAYVPTACAEPGTRLFAEVRGRRLPMAVTSLPFVPHRFKRGGTALPLDDKEMQAP